MFILIHKWTGKSQLTSIAAQAQAHRNHQSLLFILVHVCTDMSQHSYTSTQTTINQSLIYIQIHTHHTQMNRRARTATQLHSTQAHRITGGNSIPLDIAIAHRTQRSPPTSEEQGPPPSSNIHLPELLAASFSSSCRRRANSSSASIVQLYTQAQKHA